VQRSVEIRKSRNTGGTWGARPDALLRRGGGKTDEVAGEKKAGLKRKCLQKITIGPPVSKKRKSNSGPETWRRGLVTSQESVGKDGLKKRGND